MILESSGKAIQHRFKNGVALMKSSNTLSL